MTGTGLDVVRATTPPVVDGPESVRAIVQSLADRVAIEDLVTMYALVRDDHDIDSLIECFAPDGMFLDKGVEVRGHTALRQFYTGNMRRHTFSIHVPDSHVVCVESATAARGVVTGHGEFAATDTVRMCAYRYDDLYAKVGGRWVFARRSRDFIYSVPVEELSTVGRGELRIRLPGGEPRRAEWLPGPVPETG